MSRIGNKPVVIPQGVKVQVVDRGVSAEGPKGKLVQPLPPGLSAKVEDSRVIISRAGEDRKVRALHGLARSLVQNMVAGVKEPSRGSSRSSASATAPRSRGARSSSRSGTRIP